MVIAASSYIGLTFAAFINGSGIGLMLPTLVTRNMRTLPFARRAFGTGAFQSGLFLGMFVNPLFVVAMKKSLGTRTEAIGAVGLVLLTAAIVAVAVRTNELQHRSAVR